jgi:transposase-like protein
MAAAQRFFRNALSMAARRLERVTTDGLDSYPRAIKEVVGDDIAEVRTVRSRRTESASLGTGSVPAQSRRAPPSAILLREGSS